MATLYRHASICKIDNPALIISFINTHPGAAHELAHRHLELDWLRALVTIVDCGGFLPPPSSWAAANRPSACKIKRLEDTVGQPVLRRSQGQVDGQPARSQVLLDYARRMLRLNDEAWACFAQPQMAGRLRLGLPEN